MPLWNIYHTQGTFASQEIRNKFAQDITKIYSRGENGLPAFYVVVQFIPLPTGHVFVGGETRDEKPFVRLVIQHMAVHSHEGVHMEDFPKQFSDYINATIKPYIADKGYDWEITVTDTQREFWRFNGIAPPPWRSEAERVWARDGRPSEWEGNKE